MVRGFLILIVLLILLITGAPAVAQKPMFEVSVDRTIIHVDETFHLTITLTGPHSGIALDLSPFTKDFDMLSTSQHTHSANIDGQTEISMEWIITLAPKRLGELVIPSIEVGNHRSPPISVTVLSPEQAGLSRSVYEREGSSRSTVCADDSTVVVGGGRGRCSYHKKADEYAHHVPAIPTQRNE